MADITPVVTGFLFCHIVQPCGAHSVPHVQEAEAKPVASAVAGLQRPAGEATTA